MTTPLPVTTPLQVRAVSAISGGILVEREVSSHDGLPVLFSLMHPLDDFCPVTFRRPTAGEAVADESQFSTRPLILLTLICTVRTLWAVLSWAVQCAGKYPSLEPVLTSLTGFPQLPRM